MPTQSTPPQIEALSISGDPSPRLTHYLFRYPAKFHPPVVRALLDRYTDPGDVVLDPFVGSGTLLVESAVAGRNSVGTDIDPVAVQVAAVKVHRYQPSSVAKSAEVVRRRLAKVSKPGRDYEKLQWKDLSEAAYAREAAEYASWIPAIPNLMHWFRKYVVVDLARIRWAIETADIPATHCDLFRVVFASIIRNASNADPVPVSGLEVTSHMKRRDDAGRVVDPYTLFDVALDRAITAVSAFSVASSSKLRHSVYSADATALPSNLQCDAVITSPPYHGAVDYYRRHQLEMFWLGLTESQEDRLDLLPKYIGRPKVARRDPLLQQGGDMTALVETWEKRIREVSAERAQAFRHYMLAMERVFSSLSRVLPDGGSAVFVVGNSTWNGARIPTPQLFKEVAGDQFDLSETLSYPVKNRYMSYSRHNGADISEEFVLAFRRTSSPT